MSAGILKIDKRGREYVSYPDGKTSFSAADVEEAKGGKMATKATKPTTTTTTTTTTKPAARSTAGCKVVSAMTLHARPRMDICDADLLPIARGLVMALARQAGRTGPTSLIEQADRAGRVALEDCCDEGSVDLGEELARIMTQELLRQRVNPAGWLAMMPADLAIAYQADQPGSGPGRYIGGGGLGPAGGLPGGGVGLDPLPDQPLDAVADGISSIWQRMAGGASGAAVGSRAGPYGAAIGGLIGALFPEIVEGIEQALSGGQMDLFGPAPASPASPASPNSKASGAGFFEGIAGGASASKPAKPSPDGLDFALGNGSPQGGDSLGFALGPISISTGNSLVDIVRQFS